MKIQEKAVDYLQKQKGDFFLIQGIKNENFSGCGCSSVGIKTISAEVVVGYGDIPEGFHVEESNGAKAVILPEVEACLTPETEIKLDSILFIKTLSLINIVPAVVRAE